MVSAADGCQGLSVTTRASRLQVNNVTGVVALINANIAGIGIDAVIVQLGGSGAGGRPLSTVTCPGSEVPAATSHSGLLECSFSFNPFMTSPGGALLEPPYWTRATAILAGSDGTTQCIAPRLEVPVPNGD